MSIDGEILRRHFIAIATDEYDDPRWTPLSGVRGEVEAMRNWLCDEGLGERRFEPRHAELAANPTIADIRGVLESPAQEWTDADAVALFVTGHGEPADDTHYIILKRTDSGKLKRTAVRSADVLGWLAETSVQYLLIILDACYAGKVVADVLRMDESLPKTWLVLPSATKNQKAVTGALTGAIVRFLTELGSREGEKWAGQTEEYLNVPEFLAGLQEQLDASGQRVVPLYGSQPSGPHRCLPNPHYRAGDTVETSDTRHELALSRTDLATHWGPRSRGVAGEAEPGWLFTGRAELMRTLIAAATGLPGATVITGGAGSGKSAVLSRLVTLSDTRFLTRYAAEVADIPHDLSPPSGAVDVAVLATGKLHTYVLAQICQALRVPSPVSRNAEPSVDERLTAWYSWLQDHQRPVTIVVDALDEASNPHTLVSDVLARLDPDPEQPRIRLLVGVRSPGGVDDLVASAPVPGGLPLADATVVALRGRRIRVDESPWWEQDDIAKYADSILLHTPHSLYAVLGSQVRTQVAARLGQRAGRSFLLARIAASSLARRSTIVAADDPNWLAVLDEGMLGVFRDELYESVPREADRMRAVTLLRAVAFAFGRGLPWRQVWPRVATAIAEGDGDYGDRDVAWLLDSRLAAYLVTDREDDTTVYRLFHHQLRTTLRTHWRRLLEEPTHITTVARDSSAPNNARPNDASGDRAAEEGGSLEDEIRTVEANITRELRRLAELPDGAGLRPPAYIRRHLTEHAYAGGILDDRTLPNSFLPYLDPTRLGEVVTAGPYRDPHVSPPIFSIIRQATHLWDWNRPAHNASAIQMWAALNHLPFVKPIGGSWHVRWAIRPPDHSVILDSQNSDVWAVATATLPDGRVVAVTGGGEKKVRVWDLVGGVPVGAALSGHEGAVVAVAAAVLPDGRVVAVTGGEDGLVRVWDLVGGVPVGAALGGHEGAVVAVAAAVLPDGRVVAVTGGEDGLVRVWDLVGGVPVGAALGGHEGAVVAVATAVSADRRSVAVTGGRDATVRMWNLTTGTAVGEPLIGHTEPVTSIATAMLSDGRIVAVTASEDETVLVWDLTIGVPMGEPLTGHTGTVEAVAIASLSSRQSVAVTGGRDGTVRMWDLAPSVPIGRADAAHTGAVEAAATAELPDGRVVAVTSEGATVRVRDIRTGNSVGEPLTGHPSSVVSVATAVLPDGRVVAVTGGWDATVRVWDLATSRAIDYSLTGHIGAVAGIATAVLPDGRVVAVTGGWDATVRVWDLATGLLCGAPLTGHTGGVVSVATAVLPDGRVVAVTGGRDATVRVWDLATGSLCGAPLTGHTDDVMTIATTVLPDGRAVAVSGDKAAAMRVWDLVTGSVISARWTDHTGGVVSVAAATLPGGRAVAITGSEDPIVRVADLTSGVPIGEPLPTPDTVHALAVHHCDRPWLVIGGAAGVAVAELLQR